MKNKIYVITVIMHNGNRDILLLTNSKIKAEQVKYDYVDRDAQICSIGEMEASKLMERNLFIQTYII